MNNDYNLHTSNYTQQQLQSEDTRKITRSFKKKSHPRENKLFQAPVFQEDTFKQSPAIVEHTPSFARQYRNLNPKSQQVGIVRSLTEVKKKEKENKSYEQFGQNNIFKHPSSLVINKINKQDIRLPTLDKKKSTFDELNDLIQNPEKRRVVKISIQKLKPLHPEQVKRRFMMKYQIQTPQKQ